MRALANRPIRSCHALIIMVEYIPEEQALSKRIELEALTHMPISSHPNDDRPA